MEIKKMGARYYISPEMFNDIQIGREQWQARLSGFKRRGHTEPRILTDEQRAQLAEAHRLLEEFEDAAHKNPYLGYGADGDWYVDEPSETVFVPDETTEEWLARWRESGQKWLDDLHDSNA